MELLLLSACIVPTGRPGDVLVAAACGQFAGPSRAADRHLLRHTHRYIHLNLIRFSHTGELLRRVEPLLLSACAAPSAGPRCWYGALRAAATAPAASCMRAPTIDAVGHGAAAADDLAAEGLTRVLSDQGASLELSVGLRAALPCIMARYAAACFGGQETQDPAHPTVSAPLDPGTAGACPAPGLEPVLALLRADAALLRPFISAAGRRADDALELPSTQTSGAAAAAAGAEALRAVAWVLEQALEEAWLRPALLDAGGELEGAVGALATAAAKIGDRAAVAAAASLRRTVDLLFGRALAGS